MKMNIKIRKKDVVSLLLIHAFLFGIILAMVGNKNIYGSYIDWINQHSVLPDLFRQSLYEHGVFFPKFTLSLGGGQNIYNFAYYGLLNPVTLVSYLFPFVSMVTYVQISSIIMVILSVVLFYTWLRKKGLSDRVVIASTFLFACASPLLYHSHKQIMFMDYMPFLILALMGVDRLFYKKKRGLLAINVCLMFLTSYFFAVSGVIMLTIYAIYVYMDREENAPTEPLWRAAICYVLPVISGILMACIVLLPSLVAILAGRDGKQNPLSLSEMLIPNFPLQEICYASYGMGLTGIAMLAMLAFLLICRQKSRTFLAGTILIISCFPICRWILNGTLYTRGKALIPFLPLTVLIVAYFLEETFAFRYQLKKLLIIMPFVLAFLFLTILPLSHPSTAFCMAADLLISLLFLYLCRRRKQPLLLLIPVCVISALVCISINFSDTLITREHRDDMYSSDKLSLLTEFVAKDDTIYRSNDVTDPKSTNNILYTKNYLQTGMYSSVLNVHYKNFFNCELELANPTINPISLTNTKDAAFQRLMGVKYLVSDTDAPFGYQKVDTNGKFSIYKNDSAYALGFAAPKSACLPASSYQALSPADKELSLLSTIVLPEETNEPEASAAAYTSSITDSGITPDLESDFGFSRQTDGFYQVDLKEPKTFTLTAPKALNKQMYIVECLLKQYEKQRAGIVINGVPNTLSPIDSAFPNDNFHFKFMISSLENTNKLDITFSKGHYEVKDFKITTLPLSLIEQSGSAFSQMEQVTFNHDDTITGKISLPSDGYFTTTIPYDEGFTLYVDGMETEKLMTDRTFVGCKLSAGEHEIKMVYEPPFFRTARILSSLGVLLFFALLLWQRRQKN